MPAVFWRLLVITRSIVGVKPVRGARINMNHRPMVFSGTMSAARIRQFALVEYCIGATVQTENRRIETIDHVYRCAMLGRAS